MNIPMSVPKTTLESRDLIFKEIEEEAIQERREGQPQEVENNSNIIGQNMTFWKLALFVLYANIYIEFKSRFSIIRIYIY